MSFGAAFGKLVKLKRGVEGLTQQALAVAAFGDESFKTRVSELENGKVANPQAKTIDAIVLALSISREELDGLLNKNPHPRIVDNLCDFFAVNETGRLNIEIAVGETRAVFFHNRHLTAKIKRAEFFVEEKMFVCLETKGSRRPAGLPVGDDVAAYLKRFGEILFVYLDDQTGEAVAGETYPLKIIE